MTGIQGHARWYADAEHRPHQWIRFDAPPSPAAWMRGQARGTADLAHAPGRRAAQR